MKKLFSMILAIAMVLSLSTFVMAAPAPTEGSITITASFDITGRTFDAYLLFSVTDTYTDTDGQTHYNYVATDLLMAAVNQIKGAEWAEKATNDDYVEYVADQETALQKEALAEVIMDLIEAGGYDKVITLTGEGKAAVATGIAYGHYIIIETNYGDLEGATPMIFALDTTNANITLKGTKTTLDKSVLGNTGEPIDLENHTGYDIGEDVTYQLKASYPHIIEETYEAKYTFVDKMEDGLTYNNDAVLKIGTVTIPLDAVGVSYVQNGNEFELVIDFLLFNESLLGLDKDVSPEGLPVTVTYTAEVNKDALDLDALKNKATLTFDNDGKTYEYTAKKGVKTFDFEISKKNPADESLEGAEFELKNPAGAVMYFTEGRNEKNEVIYLYDGITEKFEEDGVTPTNTSVLISGTDGYVRIHGIKAGTYALKETKAPRNYNLLVGDVLVTIDKDGNVYKDSATDSVDEIVVVNETGVELPGTGGMGTAMFTILGTIIMAGAAFVLVINKKRIFNV